MIYIQERSLRRQLEALQLASGSHALTAVLWLYPDCLRRTMCGLPVAQDRQALEPVTTYGEESHPGRRTLAQPFNAAFIARLMSQKSKVSRRCDSLALYPAQSPEWASCAIPHEGIILLKSPISLSTLRKAGFSISETAPRGW